MVGEKNKKSQKKVYNNKLNNCKSVLCLFFLIKPKIDGLIERMNNLVVRQRNIVYQCLDK